VEGACVVRIGFTDKPVEAFSLPQATGAMMNHRGGERLLGTAPGIHGDISKAKSPALAPVARPVAPETQIDLAGAAVDPDRLIAGQRSRRPEGRIASDVGGGMQDERWAAIRARQDGLFLISDNVRVAMMPWRLMGIGPSVAAAEYEDGREGGDGSHQHDLRPLSVERLNRECSRRLAG
jgi:hypothetical protein